MPQELSAIDNAGSNFCVLSSKGSEGHLLYSMDVRLNKIMLKNTFLLILLLGFLSTSCIFESDSEEIVGEYELVWIDFKENRTIYKGEEQLSGYVASVGYNDDYIIAKQHPQRGDFYSEPDYSVTNYYIIDIKKNETGYKKGVIGPLTESQFDAKLNELGIRDKIEFTID